MKYNGFPTVNRLSPLRRFGLMLQIDPTRAALFYAIMGILLFVTMLGSIYAFNARGKTLEDADIGTAPQRTGIATVVGRTQWFSGGKTPNISGLALNVTIDGKQATTRQGLDERTFGVMIGDKIQVTYRIGKSGTVYVETWQPIAK